MLLDENNIPVKEEVISRVKSDITHYGIATFNRFIPSSFDGLKPVARRILYICWEHRIDKLIKVSKLGGLVAGLHPHGDTSITDAIVKLAQDGVTANHALLHPEGTFGYISDLSPASPRYISTKVSNFGHDVVISLMDKNSMEMIEAESDWGEKEPLFLPSKIPLGLINGGMGVAVSFTSNIPQHNLSEIADIVVRFIKNKDISAFELSRGLYPDYVVGGTIINGDDIPEHYYNVCDSGGSVRVRGDTEIDLANNRIIVRSMPLSFDFDSFINKVKSIINEKDSSGNPKNLVLASISYIGEARDNNNSDPYVYITCKGGTNLVEVLDNLYKHTNLEYSNKINLTFNYNGKIKKGTLKEVIKDWYEANSMIRRRKIIYNINNLENKVHVLEGLLKIYPNIDTVISMIRNSSEAKDDVVLKLKRKFDLTLIQARGIYEMQIGSLTRRSKGELQKTIDKLKDAIKINTDNLMRIDDIMIEDVLEIKRKYGRPRRTKVISKLKEREDIVISNGAILASRNNIGIFDSSNIISGKKILNGFKGVKIDGKWVKEIINSHRIDDDISSVVTFYENGTVNIHNPSNINCWVNNKTVEESGFITAVCPVYKNIKGTILCISDDGNIKQFNPEDSITVRPSNSGMIVKNCIFVPDKNKDDTVLFVNENGEYLHIKISDVPLLGKTAKGVMTSFNNGNIRMTIVDDSKTHIVVLMKNELLNTGFVYTIDKTEIKLMNRINKPKNLHQFKDFKCTGISDVDLNIKAQIGLFISENSTMSLKITNLRRLKEPRKISCIAFDFIPIEIV